MAGLERELQAIDLAELIADWPECAACRQAPEQRGRQESVEEDTAVEAMEKN